MDSYNLPYTLGSKQQKRLSDLARRCRRINGWEEQELLQHAATANYKADIDLKLDFGEGEVDQLENQFCRQTAREQLCISDEEHANCQRVADVFSEMYSADLLVLDAGRDLFNELWNEWLTAQLFAFTKDTPLADLD